MAKESVILGLSGGVDSACCAAMLRQQGYQVTGAFLSWGNADPADARRVAETLGIDFMAIDMAGPLEREVITPFVQGYLNGKTPIPCVLCNPAVKFRLLFAAADRLGAEYVATGHYARIGRSDAGFTALYRSPSRNDQAYMLYRLPYEWLSRLLLPLGGGMEKEEIRFRARQAGISIHNKPDSMEICFIPDNNYTAFIESRGACPPPGDFVDEQGRVLGRHRGIHHYTVGQRRGLGIAAEGRLYVTRIEPDTNRVVLSLNDPQKAEIDVEGLHILAPELAAESEFPALVRVRHGKTEVPAQIIRTGEETARVLFNRPARAPSPGQSAVFFDSGGRVLGGGFICR